MLSAFGKDQMQKPEFSGCITLTCVRTNATGSYVPASRTLGSHVLNAIYLQNRPLYGLCNSSLVQVGDGLETSLQQVMPRPVGWEIGLRKNKVGFIGHIP